MRLIHTFPRISRTYRSALALITLGLLSLAGCADEVRTTKNSSAVPASRSRPNISTDVVEKIAPHHRPIHGDSVEYLLEGKYCKYLRIGGRGFYLLHSAPVPADNALDGTPREGDQLLSEQEYVEMLMQKKKEFQAAGTQPRRIQAMIEWAESRMPLDQRVSQQRSKSSPSVTYGAYSPGAPIAVTRIRQDVAARENAPGAASSPFGNPAPLGRTAPLNAQGTIVGDVANPFVAKRASGNQIARGAKVATSPEPSGGNLPLSKVYVHLAEMFDAVRGQSARDIGKLGTTTTIDELIEFHDDKGKLVGWGIRDIPGMFTFQELKEYFTTQAHHLRSVGRIDDAERTETHLVLMAKKWWERNEDHRLYQGVLNQILAEMEQKKTNNKPAAESLAQNANDKPAATQEATTDKPTAKESPAKATAARSTQPFTREQEEISNRLSEIERQLIEHRRRLNDVVKEENELAEFLGPQEAAKLLGETRDQIGEQIKQLLVERVKLETRPGGRLSARRGEERDEDAARTTGERPEEQITLNVRLDDGSRSVLRGSREELEHFIQDQEKAAHLAADHDDSARFKELATRLRDALAQHDAQRAKTQQQSGGTRPDDSPSARRKDKGSPSAAQLERAAAESRVQMLGEMQRMEEQIESVRRAAGELRNGGLDEEAKRLQDRARGMERQLREKREQLESRQQEWEQLAKRLRRREENRSHDDAPAASQNSTSRVFDQLRKVEEKVRQMSGQSQRDEVPRFDGPAPVRAAAAPGIPPLQILHELRELREEVRQVRGDVAELRRLVERKQRSGMEHEEEIEEQVIPQRESGGKAIEVEIEEKIEESPAKQEKSAPKQEETPPDEKRDSSGLDIQLPKLQGKTESKSQTAAPVTTPGQATATMFDGPAPAIQPDRELERRLHERVSCSFNGSPLKDFLSYISATLRAPVMFDDSIVELKVKPSEIKVFLAENKRTVAEVLDAGLESHGLSYIVEGRSLRITTLADALSRLRRQTRESRPGHTAAPASTGQSPAVIVGPDTHSPASRWDNSRAPDFYAPFPPGAATRDEVTEMDEILGKWEQESQRVRLLTGDYYRWDYDRIMGIERRGKGTITFDGAQRGKITLEPRPAVAGETARAINSTGQPMKLESLTAETVVWTDRQVIVVGGDSGMVRNYTIPQVRPKEANDDDTIFWQTINPMYRRRVKDERPPSPTQVIPFAFGIRAEEIAERYDLRIVHRAGSVVTIEARPRLQTDAQNYRELFVQLDLVTYLPVALKLVNVRGDYDTVYRFSNWSVNPEVLPNGQGTAAMRDPSPAERVLFPDYVPATPQHPQQRVENDQFSSQPDSPLPRMATVTGPGVVIHSDSPLGFNGLKVYPTRDANIIEDHLMVTRVSMHMTRSTLYKILMRIGAQANVRIAMDNDSLKEIGTKLDERTFAINVDKVPAADALKQLLEPLKLSYVVHRGAVVITTAELAKTRLLLER